MYSPFIYSDQPMVLANPLKTQYQAYNQLNTSRIMALQNKNTKKHLELKSVKGMYKGMFVILDSKQGNKSLTICPSLDLYKIKEISDCKMAITITNVRTHAEQTVTPDRLELITETDLISLQNNTDVFQIMAKANRKVRHNFKPGNYNASYRYYPILPEENDHLGDDNTPTDDVVQVENRDPQGSSILNPDWPQGTEGQEYKGSQVDESTNSSKQFPQIEDSHTDQEPKPAIKYSLRNREIYSTLIINSKTITKLCLKNLQAIGTRDEYAAAKKALRTHSSICQVPSCLTCKFELESRDYLYSPTNMSHTTLIKDQSNTNQSTIKKSVSFARDTSFTVQSNSSTLNLKKLNQAWNASTSLLETNLII